MFTPCTTLLVLCQVTMTFNGHLLGHGEVLKDAMAEAHSPIRGGTCHFLIRTTALCLGTKEHKDKKR